MQGLSGRIGPSLRPSDSRIHALTCCATPSPWINSLSPQKNPLRWVQPKPPFCGWNIKARRGQGPEFALRWSWTHALSHHALLPATCLPTSPVVLETCLHPVPRAQPPCHFSFQYSSFQRGAKQTDSIIYLFSNSQVLWVNTSNFSPFFFILSLLEQHTHQNKLVPTLSILMYNKSQFETSRIRGGKIKLIWSDLNFYERMSNTKSVTKRAIFTELFWQSSISLAHIALYSPFFCRPSAL